MFANMVWTDGDYVCHVGKAFIYCNLDNVTLCIIALVGVLVFLYFLVDSGDYEYEL